MEEWKALWDTDCYMHSVFEEQLKHDTAMPELVEEKMQLLQNVLLEI